MAIALGIALVLQTGTALGGATIASLGGPSVISPVVAAYPCGYSGTRIQHDNFVWQGNGAYRLHGWLFYDESASPGCGPYRQWHYGEDSRNCDGCAYKIVSTQTVHGKYWVCGTLKYDSTITQYNVAYTVLTPGVWEYYGGCGPQASLSGHQDKAGVFSYDFYLNF